MPVEFADLLSGLANTQEDLKARQMGMARVLDAHTDILGLMSGQLSIIIDKLTPDASEGPTLQELLAELVVRVGDGLVLLRNLDRKIDDLTAQVPDRAPRTIKSDNSGNGARQPNNPRDGA
jgi:hypothetical protein